MSRSRKFSITLGKELVSQRMGFGHKWPSFGPISILALAIWQEPGAAEPQPFVLLCVRLRNAIHFADLAHLTLMSPVFGMFNFAHLAI